MQPELFEQPEGAPDSVLYVEPFAFKLMQFTAIATNLRTSEVLMLFVLHTHMNKDTGLICPSLSLLMREMKAKRNTVNSAKNSLIQKGWIRKSTVKNNNGRLNNYQIYIPLEWVKKLSDYENNKGGSTPKRTRGVVHPNEPGVVHPFGTMGSTPIWYYNKENNKEKTTTQVAAASPDFSTSKTLLKNWQTKYSIKGLTERTLETLAKYPLDQIQKQLEGFDARIKTKPMNNPVGYLMAALKNDYAIPTPLDNGEVARALDRAETRRQNAEILAKIAARRATA